MVDGLSEDELKDPKRRDRHTYPTLRPLGPAMDDLETSLTTLEDDLKAGKRMTILPAAVADLVVDAAEAELAMSASERRGGTGTVSLSQDSTYRVGLPIEIGVAVQDAVERLAQAVQATSPEESTEPEKILGRECKDLSMDGMTKLAQAMASLCGNDYDAALDAVSELTEGDVDPALAVVYTLAQMVAAVGTNFQLIKLAERDQRDKQGIQRVKQAGYDIWNQRKVPDGQ